jgi:hypothetical protein
MVRRSRSLFVSAMLVVPLASAACVAILGLDKLSEKPAATDANVADANADAATEAVCGTDSIDEAFPEPEVQDLGDAGSRYFAFNKLDLGAGVGFNLDHRVTTADASTRGCTFPTDNVDYVTDPTTGVDSTFAALLQGPFISRSAIEPEKLNASIGKGAFGMVVRLDGWNGDDDDNVRLAFLPAVKRISPDAGDPSSGRSDLWQLAFEYFSGLPPGTSIRSDRAWVRKGTLFARFTTFLLPIRVSLQDQKFFHIVLSDAWLTAAVGNDTLTDGVIAGRLKSSDFVREVRLTYVVTGDAGYLCSPSTAAMLGFGNLVTGGCAARDIRSSHCDDGLPTPCDAVSFGAGFAAYAVDPQTLYSAPLADRCEDAGLLPPEKRCLNAGDVDASVDCPPEPAR